MNHIDTPRERLLAGALTCVRTKGLTATTSRDIAASSGVNLAGITYHFSLRPPSWWPWPTASPCTWPLIRTPTTGQ